MTDDSIFAESSVLMEVAREAAVDVSGSSRPWEQQLLYALARASGATSLLEVGTHVGLASVWLAVAAQQNHGQLITIDFNAGTAAVARERLAHYGLQDVATVMVGPAEDVIAGMHASKTFDFVFMDADHHLQNFEPIFDVVWPRVRPGGLFCAHDIDFVDADERWWFPQKFPHGLLVSTVHGNIHQLPLGLGIAQKPREVGAAKEA